MICTFICIYVAAVKVLREKDYPLIERVMMGALEDNGKIYIMEKDKAFDISIEVGGSMILQ